MWYWKINAETSRIFFSTPQLACADLEAKFERATFQINQTRLIRIPDNDGASVTIGVRRYLTRFIPDIQLFPQERLQPIFNQIIDDFVRSQR
jgi:hypothetical protein